MERDVEIKSLGAPQGTQFANELATNTVWTKSDGTGTS
jgi:hypothetical protein